MLSRTCHWSQGSADDELRPLPGLGVVLRSNLVVVLKREPLVLPAGF